MKYFHPRRIYNHIRLGLSNFVVYWLIPDKWYLSWKFKKVFGRPIDWKNPKSFNEKINWLKIYDGDPKYHLLVDKLRVKPIVASVIGEEYIIPTIAGGFTKISEIDKDKLPDKFVLKCNHDAASVIVCTDKSIFDWNYAEYKLNWCMGHDYYHWENKQWAYKGVERCIFVEQYMEDNETHDLSDYKFYCFDGKVRIIFVGRERFTNKEGVLVNLYDRDWNRMPFEHNHANFKGDAPKPEKLEKMIELAEKLSGFIGNPYIRVDMYNINGKIYFGEFTFYHAGGFGYFNPKGWDYTLGSWIDLSALKKK